MPIRDFARRARLGAGNYAGDEPVPDYQEDPRQGASLRILIVDDEDVAIDRVAGVLLQARTPWPAAVARSIPGAKRSLHREVPDVIVFDPDIATVDEAVAFVREVSSAHPEVVWVLHTYDRWWRRHGRRLLADDGHPSISGLRRLNKGATYMRGGERLAGVLAQCESDVILRRLVKLREGGVREASAADGTIAGLHQFIAVNLTPMLARLGGDISDEERKPAFVSTRFDRAGRDRFENVVRRVLEDSGFRPIIMYERPKHNTESLPSAVLTSIAQAALFVADLTDATPDVFVEVGAAWMVGAPMALLASAKTDLATLPVLVRTQHINTYDGYADLRDKLLNAIEQA